MPLSSREDLTKASTRKESFSAWVFRASAWARCSGVSSLSASREAYSSRLAMGVLVWWDTSAIRAAILLFSSARFRAEEAEPLRNRDILDSRAEGTDSSKELSKKLPSMARSSIRSMRSN